MKGAELTKPSYQIEEPVTAPQPTDKSPGSRNFFRAAFANYLPKVIVTEVRLYRRYKGNERLIYLKLRLLDMIGRGGKKLKAPTTARSFVFVCFGNIMRSPMSEALMRRELSRCNYQASVASAGIHATPGTRAHPWALAAARELDISLEQHRSQLLTAEMVDRADAIFAMDYQNQVELLSYYPKARGKIFMLAAYAGDLYGGVEIPDPYYGDAEETLRCYRVLQTCIQNVAANMLRSQEGQ